MKVKDLITKLLDYNMDADVKVVAHCKEEDFSLTFGGDEGVEKHNTDRVVIYVDRLCSNEQANVS